MELTQTEYDLYSSGVAEDNLTNDREDSYGGDATDDMDLDPTAFMGEGQWKHVEEYLYEGDNGQKE